MKGSRPQIAKYGDTHGIPIPSCLGSYRPTELGFQRSSSTFVIDKAVEALSGRTSRGPGPGTLSNCSGLTRLRVLQRQRRSPCGDSRWPSPGWMLASGLSAALGSNSRVRRHSCLRSYRPTSARPADRPAPSRDRQALEVCRPIFSRGPGPHLRTFSGSPCNSRRPRKSQRPPLEVRGDRRRLDRILPVRIAGMLDRWQ